MSYNSPVNIVANQFNHSKNSQHVAKNSPLSAECYENVPLNHFDPNFERYNDKLFRSLEIGTSKQDTPQKIVFVHAI